MGNNPLELTKQDGTLATRKHYLPIKAVAGLILGLILVLAIFASAILFSWFPVQSTSFQAGSATGPRIGEPVCGEWSLASGPQQNLGRGRDLLSDVVAVDDDDIWAIGETIEHSPFRSRPLIQHWDGKTWSIIPGPEVDGTIGNMSKLAVISATDIWAVGSYFKAPDHIIESNLMMHWNGKDWSIVPTPNPGVERNTLSGIAAVSSDDVWAVGHYEIKEPRLKWRTHIMHWDGRQWSTIPSPNFDAGPGYNTFASTLSNVTAIGLNDIWAVGDWSANKGNAYGGNLAMHWDGNEWRISPVPKGPDRGDQGLTGVVALGSNDVWAVGLGWYGSARIVHWDGTQWSMKSSPSGDAHGFPLLDISALAPNNVWAAGSADADRSGDLVGESLLLHWNGSQWNRLESPNGPMRNTMFAGITTTPSGDIWVVGSTDDYPSDDGAHMIPLPGHALAAHFRRMPCSQLVTPNP